jgi:hypothetical protein
MRLEVRVLKMGRPVHDCEIFWHCEIKYYNSFALSSERSDSL